jgi:hypothetical protein
MRLIEFASIARYGREALTNGGGGDHQVRL